MKLHPRLLHDKVIMVCSLLLCGAGVSWTAELKQETVSAWDAYIQAANTRMEERIHSGRFLWTDENPDRVRRVRAGEVLVAPGAEHNPINVSQGLIHDWIGATFLPNAKLEEVLAVVRDYARYKQFYAPSVVDSRCVGEPGGNDDKFAVILLNKSLFLKTALDSEYESSYVQLDGKRWYDISHSTHLQEIQDFGQPGERRLPADQGSGYIWRLYTVTRFEERDGGVYVEVEAIALSRAIPKSVRWFVNPIVRRVSKNALLISLRQTADAVHSAGDAARSGARRPPAVRASTRNATGG